MLIGIFRLEGRREDRIPSFCKKLGLRRMDIIWVEAEMIPASHFAKIKKIRRKEDLALQQLADTKMWNRNRILRTLRKDDPFDYCYDAQLTILTARIGANETVRFFNGEISPVSDENLALYLEEDAYVPATFEERDFGVKRIIMEESLRDIVDALMLDGLSRSEAIQELLSADEGVSDEHKDQLIGDMATRKPNHYYKVTDEVFNIFN